MAATTAPSTEAAVASKTHADGSARVCGGTFTWFQAVQTFSGTRVIPVAPTAVAAALSDSKRATEWVSSLVSQEEVERSDAQVLGQPHDYVCYQHYTLGGPLADRDYVIQGRWSEDSEVSVCCCSS